MKSYFYLVILCLSLPIHAQWYESTGHAQIIDGNNKEAKTRAVEDAIKQALIFAGASVTSVQTVANGLMTQEKTHVSSHGEIQEIEFIDEVYSGDSVSVTLRLDIFTNEEQCYESEFKKSIAITQVQIPNLEQARMGQIFNINKAFSEKIFKHIKSTVKKIIPRPYYKQAIRVSNFFEQQYNFNSQIIEQIAKNSDSQYVLISQIKDISMGEKQNSQYKFWESDSFERFFELEIMLFNSITHEIVIQQNYSTSGAWQFDKTAKVDPNSQKFWRSGYGQSINNLSKQISSDIQKSLNCQPIQGKIKHIKGNTISFNLGKQHGVKKGQSFVLAHRSFFTDEDGVQQPHIITNSNHIRVSQVYNRSAIANSIGDELLANIQTSDLVLLVPVEELEL